MMKSFFILSSTIDDLVGYWYVGLVFGLMFLSYLIKRLKFLKSDRILFNEDSISQKTKVGNYTFNFRKEVDGLYEVQPKKVSLFAKTILFSMVFLLIFTPFYELVETLKPVGLVYYYSQLSCFP